MKVFCPKCEQLYCPKSKYKDLDGAHFGTSFPQIFLQAYPSLLPLDPPQPFVPRVFGFRIRKQRSMLAGDAEEERRAGAQDRQGGATASKDAPAAKP
mmetsp:Transcript_129805/g.403733  ORF Transcript_129805/g.403733 Transcript_129805/m.403733 type:complete len:97 (-) Transcript_129805:137-427(-)